MISLKDALALVADKVQAAADAGDRTEAVRVLRVGIAALNDSINQIHQIEPGLTAPGPGPEPGPGPGPGPGPEPGPDPALNRIEASYAGMRELVFMIARDGAYGDPENYRLQAEEVTVTWHMEHGGLPMDFVGAISTAQGMCDRFGGKFCVYHYPSQPDHYRITRPESVPVQAGAEIDAEMEPTPWEQRQTK